jgi:hypothetical protein
MLSAVWKAIKAPDNADWYSASLNRWGGPVSQLTCTVGWYKGTVPVVGVRLALFGARHKHVAQRDDRVGVNKWHLAGGDL